MSTLKLYTLWKKILVVSPDFSIEKGALKHYTKRDDIKEKIDILDFIQTRNLYYSEDTLEEVKWQVTNWEKKFSINTTNEALYKEVLKTIFKSTNNSVQK